MHHVCHCFLTLSENCRHKPKNFSCLRFLMPFEFCLKYMSSERFYRDINSSKVSSVQPLWLSSYKFSKFCVPNQHPWGLILVVFFAPYFPKYSPILVKFLTGCNIIVDKNRVLTIFEKYEFLRKNFHSECRLFGCF